jgi:hypothetical protein
MGFVVRSHCVVEDTRRGKIKRRVAAMNAADEEDSCQNEFAHATVKTTYAMHEDRTAVGKTVL